MSDELVKWLPGALGYMQPIKRLILILANVLTVFAVLQLVGLDFPALTHGNLNPVVPWWGTLALACLAMFVETRISNEQELRRSEQPRGPAAPSPS